MRRKITHLAVALAAMILPVAQAGELTSRPLKGFSVCDSSSNFVSIDVMSGFLPTNAVERIKNAARTKMLAYKMLTPLESCISRPMSKVSFVSISIVVTDPVMYNHRGLSITTSVYTSYQPEIDGAVALWNLTSAGVSSASPDEFADYLIGGVQAQIDRLAADYALANP